MSVLTIEHVHKRYGDVSVLTDVTVRIDAGDDLVIVGTSGSGKSTLLHIMGALERPSSGTVTLAGHDLTHATDAELSHLRGRYLGFVFQQAHLLDQLTAAQNVLLGLRYAGLPRPLRHRRAQEALDRVGLNHRQTHRPTQLSGGERQRVGIARALAAQPTLVLADEPTGALDQHTGAEILTLFRQLHRDGTTIAMITHDPAIAASFSRQTEICDGHLQPVQS